MNNNFYIFFFSVDADKNENGNHECPTWCGFHEMAMENDV
jgi:hypothetical protein